MKAESENAEGCYHILLGGATPRNVQSLCTN